MPDNPVWRSQDNVEIKSISISDLQTLGPEEMFYRRYHRNKTGGLISSSSWKTSSAKALVKLCNCRPVLLLTAEEAQEWTVSSWIRPVAFMVCVLGGWRKSVAGVQTDSPWEPNGTHTSMFVMLQRPAVGTKVEGHVANRPLAKYTHTHTVNVLPWRPHLRQANWNTSQQTKLTRGGPTPLGPGDSLLDESESKAAQRRMCGLNIQSTVLWWVSTCGAQTLLSDRIQLLLLLYDIWAENLQ